MGDWLVRLASFRETKGIRDYLRTHVGRNTRFDNGKIRRDLGINFRPLRETILETLVDLDGWGHLPPAAI
jgi:dihydroflavonol-4-reductase